MIAVSTVASATSVQLSLLEYDRSPINNLGSEIASIRVLNNGQVHGYRARGIGQGEWRQLATLPAEQVARLRTLITRAAKLPHLVAPVGITVNCAAVPMNKDVYRAPHFNLVLEQNTNPCGAISYNDTRSSAEIVALLNVYRNQLYGIRQ